MGELSTKEKWDKIMKEQKTQQKRQQANGKTNPTKKPRISETAIRMREKQIGDSDTETPNAIIVTKQQIRTETYIRYTEKGGWYRRYKPRYKLKWTQDTQQNLERIRKFQQLYQRGIIPTHAQKRYKEMEYAPTKRTKITHGRLIVIEQEHAEATTNPAENAQKMPTLPHKRQGSMTEEDTQRKGKAKQE